MSIGHTKNELIFFMFKYEEDKIFIKYWNNFELKQWKKFL